MANGTQGLIAWRVSIHNIIIIIIIIIIIHNININIILYYIIILYS